MHWVDRPFPLLHHTTAARALSRTFRAPLLEGRGGGVLIPSPRPVGRVGGALHRARALGTVEKNNEGGKASGAARAVARFRSPSEIIENKCFSIVPAKAWSRN